MSFRPLQYKLFTLYITTTLGTSTARAWTLVHKSNISFDSSRFNEATPFSIKHVFVILIEIQSRHKLHFFNTYYNNAKHTRFNVWRSAQSWYISFRLLWLRCLVLLLLLLLFSRCLTTLWLRKLILIFKFFFFFSFIHAYLMWCVSVCV